MTTSAFIVFILFAVDLVGQFICALSIGRPKAIIWAGLEILALGYLVRVLTY